VSMLQTYLSTMNDIGAETWIMHGSLLGWWWNRKIMPWDTDLDVMVSQSSMQHLADYYNMTVHHYKPPGFFSKGRDYMLEINPNYTNCTIEDDLNKIDARWVDMDTGLFIDITTLRTDEQLEAQGVEGAMMVKDNHHYMYNDIFPLRESLFEETPVKIPWAYSDLLIEEYGPQALTARDYQSYHFDQERMEWVPTRGVLTGPNKPGFIPSGGPSYRPGVDRPSHRQQGKNPTMPN